jgi:hypothetical protein
MYPSLSYDEVCMSSNERAVSGLSGMSTLVSLQFLDSGRPIGTRRSIATTVTLADHHPDARAYIQRYISNWTVNNVDALPELNVVVSRYDGDTSIRDRQGNSSKER